MWIRTYDGRLINLDHVRDIEDRRLDTASPPGERSLVATTAEGELVLVRGDGSGPAYEAIRIGFANAKSFVDLKTSTRPVAPA